MREKFKNLRKRKAKITELHEDQRTHAWRPDYVANVGLLKEELRKKKPKSKIIKKLMDETEQARRDWIGDYTPTVLEVLGEYPALRLQRWVST